MERRITTVAQSVSFSDEENYMDDDCIDNYSDEDIEDGRMIVEEIEENLKNVPSYMDRELYDQGQFTDEGKNKLINFLESFNVLPSLSDIIETSDEQSQSMVYPVDEVKTQIEETQTEIVTTTTTTTTTESDVSSEIDSEELSIESDWYNHLDELYLMDDAEKQGITFEEDVQILNSETKIEPLIDVTKISMIEDAELLRYEIFDATKDFLDELIDLAVNTVESEPSYWHLMKMLDKRQLMDNLVKLISECNEAYLYKYLLNAACTKYYRMHKNFKNITPDNINMIEEYKCNLIEYMKRLDLLLHEEAEMKMKNFVKRNQLKKEIRELTLDNENLFANLKQMILNYIDKNASTTLKLSIKKQIDCIVNTFRLLGRTYNSLARLESEKLSLQEEEANISDIGDGITVTQYCSLKADVQYLEEKIMERNKDIERYQNLLCRKHHIRAHWNERVRMLKDTVDCKNLGLEELREEQYFIYKYLTQLKYKRLQMQKKIRKVNFDVGLINKPLLMLDYDACTRRCQDLYKVITDLKERYNYLEGAIYRVSQLLND